MVKLNQNFALARLTNKNAKTVANLVGYAAAL